MTRERQSDSSGPVPGTSESTAALDTQDKRHDWWRPVALLAAIVGILVLAKVFGIGERLGDLQDWIQGLGPWGPVAFVFLYSAAVVAAIPGSALTVAAGALFGSVLGVILVINAATLGASLAFLIARYFARDAIARRLSTNEKFQKLDQLTEDHGAIIVALTRLVPLFPFNLLNYGFGLTRVPFWTYVGWSWLCMLPGTILYVVGADAFTKGLAQGRVPWPLVGALAVAGLILTFLVRHARRTLQERETKTKAG
ncbi:MAG: TVP38/TMEM64 family protein [candidate division NC10 bacterium]|nr:TVP38/TMEM64 family protein [candidate division NC10 bacterium]MCH7897543.1 TVP38/TMEM64 family protein [candidate division NC10 bacterium]MCZ6551567.1 TVP38/TMEM64 family protein [candidate division NC10 bacterium]